MRTRLASLVVGVIVAGFALNGCMGADRCFYPIATAVPAGIVPVPVADRQAGPNVGQCGRWVKYDGRQYTVHSPLRDKWTLTEADLEPIGHATEATDVASVADDMVYAIEGVDPTVAVAMHAKGSKREIIVLESNLPFPEALCAFFERPPTDASLCPSLRPSPTPS